MAISQSILYHFGTFWTQKFRGVYFLTSMMRKTEYIGRIIHKIGIFIEMGPKNGPVLGTPHGRHNLTRAYSALLPQDPSVPTLPSNTFEAPQAYIMPGRAHSKTAQIQKVGKAKANLYARAVKVYQAELQKKAQGLPSKGAKAVANDLMAQYSVETKGKSIKLNHCTIINHAAGKPTRADSNFHTKAYLTAGEVEAIISFIIEMGNRGFPLSYLRFKEHVDEILSAKMEVTHRK